MKKKIILICITIALILANSCVFALAFSDLSESHWAYDNIMELTNKEIINGFEDGTYRPEGTVTKGQFYKLIATTLCDKNEIEEYYQIYVTIFDHWAAPYYIYLNNNGLLMNGSSIDAIDENITRLEMAVILSNVSLKNELVNIEKNYKPTEMKDIKSLKTRYQLAIEETVNVGLIKGYEDKTFRPDGNMTRAEAATVIKRLIDRL